MIAHVIEGRAKPVGTVTVSRLLPVAKQRSIGPFVFFDHMGPAVIPPGVGFDVPPHPHIGLSTVTYFFAGENVHRDSMGTVQINRPGDVNLMTAGRGVVHSERAEPAFREQGGTLHGAQMWLGLPEDHEDDLPSFAHHPIATLPAIAPADGVTGRVLAGTAFGETSPLRHPSQPLLVDLQLAPGARVRVPEAPERGIVVIEGSVRIDETLVETNHLAVLDHPTGTEAQPTIIIAETAARILVIGGPAIGPRHMEWNWVSSDKAKIDAARTAWRAQTTPKIPGDDLEFVAY